MPGGQFRLASVPPMKSGLSKTIATYIFLGEKYGAVYHYGVKADKETLKESFSLLGKDICLAHGKDLYIKDGNMVYIGSGMGRINFPMGITTIPTLGIN